MSLLPVLADTIAPILIPVFLVLFFGVIVVVVILLKRHVKIFKNDEKPKSDKEIAAEELDRLLQPVEDLTPAEEESAKAAETPKAEEEKTEDPVVEPVDEDKAE